MAVVGEPQERPDLHHSLGNRPLPHCLNFVLICLNSVLGHYMDEIHNLHFEELTFLRLKLKLLPPQFSEDCSQPLQVFLQDCGKDGYVIKVSDASIQLEIPQTCLH